MKASDKIDVVLTWVDATDIEWQKERSKYSGVSVDDREIRYRDWDNLHYIFRGIEKFMPWVNNVYLITCGHLPKWINTRHPKLKVVKHTDYIPDEYLPTFNSNVIELNLDKLEGLSEKFILFNDDHFILKDVSPNDFFEKGKPKDAALLNVHCYDINMMYVLTPFINMGIINKYFDMKQVIKKNFTKWYSLKYGYHMLRNIMFLPCPRFPGLVIDHLPYSHLKSTFKKMWDMEYDMLHDTCQNKFRSQVDISHWLMKEWNIVSGDFSPRALSIGKSYGVYENNINELEKCILKQKYKMVCLNDTEMSIDVFEKCKGIINNALETILPERSKYEK